MEMNSISLPETSHNITVVRKYAKEKGYGLRKVRNENAWSLRDEQNGRIVLEKGSLMDVHEYLRYNDD